jgi:hypothetical protein
MKHFYSILLLFLSLTIFSCQNEIDLSNIKGIEIYLFSTECKNQNSYNQLTSISAREDFMNKYVSAEAIPVKNCTHFIDLENCKTETAPFLNQNDFEKFDWNLSKIYLTDSGMEKLKNKEIPLRGLPFVIQLNGKNVYGAWFWNVFSSFGCDRMYTYPYRIKEDKAISLEFGLGTFKCGADIRKDRELILKAIKN